MGAAIPKQYLQLEGRPIATYSVDTFVGRPEALEVVIVCAQDWRYIFEDHLKQQGANPHGVPIKYALPGKERFDSVYSGFRAMDPAASLVSVHDSARPFPSSEEISACLDDAQRVGAAVLGVACKGTIKQVDGDLMVEQTLERSRLWEVHTPQVIRPALLQRGFEALYGDTLHDDEARTPQKEVTDDVSLVELIGEPVKVTQGKYTNIKVTTPEDMDIAVNYVRS